MGLKKGKGLMGKLWWATMACQPVHIHTPIYDPTHPSAAPPALCCGRQLANAESLSAALTADREASAQAGRKLQLGQVVMACENIYLRCCDRSTVQRKTRQLPADADDEAVLGDLIEKLEFIQVRGGQAPTGG